MATLPDVPQNTIVTIGIVAAAGLAAFTQYTRTKVELTVHDNYRHAKVVDANVHAGANITNLYPERSDRPA